MDSTYKPSTVSLLLACLFAMILAGCGDDAEEASTSITSATTTTTTATTATTTTTATTALATPSTTAATDQTSSTEGSSTTTATSAVEVECSASGVERPGLQPELPAPVAERREAILTAALACDIDGLATLTGPSFTASFGGDDPAEIWAAGEQEFDYQPMRALVEILRLPPTSGDDGSGGVAYTWPPAFSYNTWDEVPEADREALRVLYDDDDFEMFAQFGGYIGYRTGITEDGTWTAFVAGD